MTRPGLGKSMAALAGALLVLCPGVIGAARAADPASLDSTREIEKYREMINDPLANPAYLALDRGEILWTIARGAKNATLEACDLGEGPGRLDGAFARLPRYFKDADQVMDPEQRLVWCMTTIQGLDTRDVVARRFGGPGTTSDMEDLVAFIANKSIGAKIDAQLSHPKEQQMYALGEALFYRRASISDFSCATCHSADGKRIRLQELPNLSQPGPTAQATMATWPAYRVSQSQTRTIQHRLWDCYRQMRMPAPDYASEGITALIVYLNAKATGGVLAVPSIKR